MAKKVKALIKLQIKAGQATPSPPVGPALGQAGANIMEFCKAFNAETQKLELGVPTPVVITVYTDRSFTFVTKSPPASFYLKRAAGLTAGSKAPGRDFKGTVSVEQLREIAAAKMNDLNANDVDAAVRMLRGTATSMGIQVTE